jgi:hypothetical protein
MKKGGQVSVEALFSLGFIALMFGTMLLYSYERQQDLRTARTAAVRLNDCLSVTTAIIGLLVNRGGTANVTVTNRIAVKSAAQVVEAGDDVPCRLATSAVTSGVFEPGRLVFTSLPNGTVEVSHA